MSLALRFYILHITLALFVAGFVVTPYSMHG